MKKILVFIAFFFLLLNVEISAQTNCCNKIVISDDESSVQFKGSDKVVLNFDMIQRFNSVSDETFAAWEEILKSNNYAQIAEYYRVYIQLDTENKTAQEIIKMLEDEIGPIEQHYTISDEEIEKFQQIKVEINNKIKSENLLAEQKNK